MSIGGKAGLACMGAMVLLAGCHKQPQGQVVATIDGKEITQQELEAEAQSANIPQSADKKVVFPAMLQRVITRKLLVGAAEKKNMDKQPDYLVQKRRIDEVLLAQAYARQQVQTASVPSATDISQYIASNPTLFADRARYTLDQIRFANPGDASKLKPLATAHTMDQVAATLKSLGIQYQRGDGSIDSGTVPPDAMKRILAVPAGEPIVIPQGGLITVSVIKGKTPVATTPDQQRAAATQLVRQTNSETVLENQIKLLKNGAKITYAKGMEPPAGPPILSGANVSQPAQ